MNKGIMPPFLTNTHKRQAGVSLEEWRMSTGAGDVNEATVSHNKKRKLPAVDSEIVSGDDTTSSLHRSKRQKMNHNSTTTDASTTGGTDAALSVPAPPPSGGREEVGSVASSSA